jgi:predicted lipoprotein
MPDTLDQLRDQLQHLTVLTRRLEASIAAYCATRPLVQIKAYDDALLALNRAWKRMQEMQDVIAHVEATRQP